MYSYITYFKWIYFTSNFSNLPNQQMSQSIKPASNFPVSLLVLMKIPFPVSFFQISIILWSFSQQLQTRVVSCGLSLNIGYIYLNQNLVQMSRLMLPYSNIRCLWNSVIHIMKLSRDGTEKSKAGLKMILAYMDEKLDFSFSQGVGLEGGLFFTRKPNLHVLNFPPPSRKGDGVTYGLTHWPKIFHTGHR